MSNPLIDIRGLEKAYRTRSEWRLPSWFRRLLRRKSDTANHDRIYALNGVSLSIEQGETLCIVGETGCGKSTLARVLMGLEKPSSGELYFSGNRIDQLTDQARMPFRKKMQMVFQNPYASLNPRMTIYQILNEAIGLHHPDLADSKPMTTLRSCWCLWD